MDLREPVDRAGHGDAGTAQVERVREAVIRGGPAALADVTPDELVQTFSIAGGPDEAHEQLARCEGVVDHVMLHPPYVPPLTSEETRDAYDRVLSALARTPVTSGDLR